MLKVQGMQPHSIHAALFATTYQYFFHGPSMVTQSGMFQILNIGVTIPGNWSFVTIEIRMKTASFHEILIFSLVPR